MKFLKLSKVFINPNAITKITFSNNRYNGECINIHLKHLNINGSFFLYVGNISSTDNLITISKKDNENDYNVVNEWLKNN